MNPLDDDYDDMIERRAELSGGGTGLPPGTAAVTAFLDDLRSLGEQAPPTPSAELAALLAGATPLSARRRHVAHPRAAIAAAAAVLVLGTTGVAAANDSLPQPAQRFVSRVIDRVTPFTIDPAPRSRTPERPVVPVPVRTPSSVPTPPGEEHTSEPAGDGAASSSESEHDGRAGTVGGEDQSGVGDGSGDGASEQDSGD